MRECLELEIAIKNMKEIYINIASLYFPVAIDAYDERQKYLESVEFCRLVDLSRQFRSSGFDARVMAALAEGGIAVHNFTIIDGGDRCFTFFHDIIYENIIHRVVICLSYLLPTYFIRLLEIEYSPSPYAWQSIEDHSELLTKQYSHLYQSIKAILEKEFGFYAFPRDLGDEVIPNISFEDILFNEFTYYNAFFKNSTL